MFQEDEQGFPIAQAINSNQNAKVLNFIKGYQKQMVQRLNEYTSFDGSTSVLIHTEDNEITELKIETKSNFIECEDDQCRCD